MASSHKMSIGMASVRILASNAMTSASAEECETADCFLHIHVIGTQDRGPAMQRYMPEVDFESLRSPAKLASTNIIKRRSSTGSPRYADMTSFLW